MLSRILLIPNLCSCIASFKPYEGYGKGFFKPAQASQATIDIATQNAVIDAVVTGNVNALIKLATGTPRLNLCQIKCQGMSLIAIAASKGNLVMVRWLFRLCDQLTQPDLQIAIGVAEQNNHKEIARFLKCNRPNRKQVIENKQEAPVAPVVTPAVKPLPTPVAKPAPVTPQVAPVVAPARTPVVKPAPAVRPLPTIPAVAAAPVVAPMQSGSAVPTPVVAKSAPVVTPAPTPVIAPAPRVDASVATPAATPATPIEVASVAKEVKMGVTERGYPLRRAKMTTTPEVLDQKARFVPKSIDQLNNSVEVANDSIAKLQENVLTARYAKYGSTEPARELPTIKPCVPQEVPAPAQQPSRLARIAGSTITATVPAALAALALKDTQLASDAMDAVLTLAANAAETLSPYVVPVVRAGLQQAHRLNPALHTVGGYATNAFGWFQNRLNNAIDAFRNPTN